MFEFDEMMHWRSGRGRAVGLCSKGAAHNMICLFILFSMILSFAKFFACSDLSWLLNFLLMVLRFVARLVMSAMLKRGVLTTAKECRNKPKYRQQVDLAALSLQECQPASYYVSKARVVSWRGVGHEHA